MKQIFICILIFIGYTSRAQIITTNVGTTSSAFDSSFVVQTSSVDSFSSQTHPGASGYSGGEVLVCQGATLKYNCMWGTSNEPTFYLEKNATMILFQDFSGKIYMKDGATLNCNNKNAYISVHRVSTAAILNNASTPFYDSVYTQVNYTFSAWPGAASPCNAPSSVADDVKQHQIVLYPNPASTYIQVENSLLSDSFELININGTKVAKGNLGDSPKIDISKLSRGMYSLLLYRNGKGYSHHTFVKQ